jgi:hypothetical protein
MRRDRTARAVQQEKRMKLDLLPSGWKLWHPIVFGLLAMIGAQLADPVVGAIMGMIGKVTS